MLSSFVSSLGSSSIGTFRALNNQMDRLRDIFEKSPEVKRDVEYLRAELPKVKDLDDLVDNQRLLGMTLSAYGLEDITYAKAFVKKLLTEGTTDRSALANRMASQEQRAMVAFFEVDTKGVENLSDPQWLNKLEKLFLDRRFESEAGESNPALANALYFKRRAPELTSWYQVLGDRRLAEVARSAMNFPKESARMEVDRVVEMMRSKGSLEDFKSPAKVGKMIDTYLAKVDAEMGPNGGAGGPQNIVLQTFANVNTGFGPIINIDPTLFMNWRR